jgi:hypothetical protein
MLNARATTAVLIAALVATYAAEQMGNAIVHSSGGLVIVALLAPGFYVAFFDVIRNDWGTYVAAFLVNVCYYWVISRLFSRTGAVRSAGIRS